MVLAPGVHEVSAAEIASAVHVASTRGVAILSLSTRGATTRADFFDAVRASLPLDPPVCGSEIWDALSDSLWEGIYHVDASIVLITWTGAADLQRASPEDYAIAMDVFRQLVSTLGNEKYTVGSPKQVCVYVA
jgi:hypothetical protein